MNTDYTIEKRHLEEQGNKMFGRLTKDRTASKTPLPMRKASRRAKNKVARKSRQLNRKV